MAWECKQCGACCRILSSHQPDNEKDRELLRHMNRGDGVCRNLDKDNKCKIYDIRPQICRVDKDDPKLEGACEKVRNLILKGAL